MGCQWESNRDYKVWMDGDSATQRAEKLRKKESHLVDIGQVKHVNKWNGVTDLHHDSLSLPPPQLTNTPSHIMAHNQ